MPDRENRTRRIKATVYAVLLLSVLAGFAALATSGGCATSKPFALAVVNASPGLLADVRYYANTPEHKAQAEELARLTGRQETVNVADVRRAWDAVKPWYVAAF